MAELTPQQKAEMAKSKELSTQLMQIIRDLTVSGGSSELIDQLSTMQNQYAKRSELPSTQQFRSLQMMEEEAPPASPAQAPVQAAEPIPVESEMPDYEYRSILGRASRPGGHQSLSEADKARAIEIAEGKL